MNPILNINNNKTWVINGPFRVFPTGGEKLLKIQAPMKAEYVR